LIPTTSRVIRVCWRHRSISLAVAGAALVMIALPEIWPPKLRRR
jgi:hypothetical protein